MSLASCHEIQHPQKQFYIDGMDLHIYDSSKKYLMLLAMAANACFVLLWNMSLESYYIFIELVFVSHESRLMKKVYRILFL